jgi:prepilin-type N-terminal cleavage/methylation domain-containing protein
MKKRTDKYGLTLIEMLIVVGIIALLTSLIVGVARRIDNQSKERLTENTIAIVNTALGQFEDYKYDYNDISYRGFVFPLDCNGFDVTLNQPQNVLSVALGTTIAMTAEPNTTFTGCEVMYFLLSQVPECRTTLDKIDKSLLTNKGTNNQDLSITIDRNPAIIGDEVIYPLIRVIDPWKTTLRYDYYDETLNLNGMKKSRRTFPVIISAGPDRIFGTSDDVKNR